MIPKQFYCIILANLVTVQLNGLIASTHGDQNASARGIHSANMIRTTFWNDGQIGTRSSSPGDIGAEWPINSGHSYIPQMSIFVEAQVVNQNGDTLHIVSEANGTVSGVAGNPSSGDVGPDGLWWSFAPLPGFYNSEVGRVAMSHQPASWPESWPDKMSDDTDPGWPGLWNSLFGKDELRADQESYYVIDDFNNKEFQFFPDSTNLEMRGLGLQLGVRGLQWSHPFIEDALYLFYDVLNVGTNQHQQLSFGLIITHIMGSSMTAGGDGADDLNSFDMEENIAFAFDGDDIGDIGWTPVGFMGLAMIKTPGNSKDGIDNDDDGSQGSGEILTEESFQARDVKAGDDIVLINYSTFERTIIQMPENGISIPFSGQQFDIKAGLLSEIPNNAFDDNLNGLVDENNSVRIGQGVNSIENFVNVGKKAINYFTENGINNILIDESHADGIDNDGDWNVEKDDVGVDGLADTNDEGEGDGIPTSGTGTVFPGEPNFELTDPDESDVIQVTSFTRYQPFTMIPLYDDELIWQNSIPGIFSPLYGEFNSNNFIMSSGYFSLAPKSMERIGQMLLFSIKKDELLDKVEKATDIYRDHFNMEEFSPIPHITADPGDNRVIIKWDDRTERYYEFIGDPIGGNNFEGYRVYRNTIPSFPLGALPPMEPIAICDIDNEYSGIVDIGGGRTFDLGNNSGLCHEYVDTDVQNGVRYFYAVTYYDHGHPDLGIPPCQCSANITVYLDGSFELPENATVVVPRDSIAGALGEAQFLDPIQGRTTGQVELQYVDSDLLKKNHIYRLSFKEKMVADRYDRADYHRTEAVYLVDTSATPYDTVAVERELSDMAHYLDLALVKHGFRLHLRNVQYPQIIEEGLTWNREDGPNLHMSPYSHEFIRGRTTLSDYSIFFGAVGVDTSKELAISSESILPVIPVNFRVKNETTNEYLDFAFFERHGDDGRFTRAVSGSDIIILFEQIEDTLGVTWGISYGSERGGELAQAGDSVYIELGKPFTSEDLYEFQIPDFVDFVEDNSGNFDFELYQNYPNPFNGTTSIYFDVPESMHLQIEIYNILGQKIATLVDGVVSRGRHKVAWLGQNKLGHQVSSGVYFYKMHSADLIKTKKLLLVR